MRTPRARREPGAGAGEHGGSNARAVQRYIAHARRSAHDLSTAARRLPLTWPAAAQASQDESIFRAQDGQQHAWRLEGVAVGTLKAKGKGAGLMLSGLAVET